MIKARKIKLRLDVAQANMVREHQMEAAACWNEIVVLANNHYRDNDGKWISKSDLQAKTKNRFKLHSQSVQALTDKYCANRDTIAELRRKGDKKARYPYREKTYLTIPFKQMAIKIQKDGTIRLSLSNGNYLYTGIKPDREINTAELIWDGKGYVFSYTAEYEIADMATDGLVAGIDLGEIHPVAITAEDGEGLIVSGRTIRAAKQWRNKSLAKLSRRISKCKKGSRQWKKLIRAKAILRNRTDNQVRDMLHKSTRQAINWCLEKGISDIVVGDLKGVEKNTKKHRRLNKKARQKVSQMEYGTLKKYLKYKAEEAGIKSCFVNERGTSKNCPECGSENHPKGRIYSCKACGFKSHRDGKAGFLIARKKHKHLQLPEKFTFAHQQCAPKYRKRMRRESLPTPACVDGPDVTLSSPVKAEPLVGALSAA